jgi:hypothetical protein
MLAICTTCTTLSHIRNLRSKVIFFLGGIDGMSRHRTSKKKHRHMLICKMSLVHGGLHPQLKNRDSQNPNGKTAPQIGAPKSSKMDEIFY